MYIYLASTDGTFNVAKGGHKGMPGGSWSVHLLVSFEVATCGGRGLKFTLKLCLSNLERRSDTCRGLNMSCEAESLGENHIKVRRSHRTLNLPSRCSSTLSGAFMSLGSFLSEQEKGNGDTEIELVFLFSKFAMKSLFGECAQTQQRGFCHDGSYRRILGSTGPLAGWCESRRGRDI